MFDIGWSELLLIGVVALIVIGPKELPGVLHAVGQWTAKIRRMAAEFQDQFREAMREAEMAELKKQIDETTQNLTSHFDLPDLNDSAAWKSEGNSPASGAATQPAAPETSATASAAPEVALPAPPEAAAVVTEKDILPAVPPSTEGRPT